MEVERLECELLPQFLGVALESAKSIEGSHHTQLEILGFQKEVVGHRLIYYAHNAVIFDVGLPSYASLRNPYQSFFLLVKNLDLVYRASL